jgi:MSHA biogenesis protein MshO
VPNSVRATNVGAVQFLEFTPISDAGRYRAATSAGNEPSGTDALDVTDPADTSFQVLDAPVTVPASAQLVIFNLGAGYTGYDLYAGANRRSVTTAAGSAQAISFTGTGVALGADSPDRHFYLVTTPVSYVCTPNAAGTGTLWRYSGYALQATQPAATGSAPLSGATASLMLDNVSACSFSVASAILANTNAVAVTLQLADATQSSEVVSLYSQIYLESAP